MGPKRTTIARAAAGSLAVCLLAACGGGTPQKQPIENQPMYKMRMAESLMNAGRVSESLATMQEAIEADPDSAPLRLQHGQLCFRAGRYEDAERAFLAALAIDPNLTDAHNFLGTVYQELGRHGDAEREYRTALEDPAYPSPQLVYLNLGLLYGDQGHAEKSIESLRRAVGIDPRFYKAHYHLATALERVGKLDEAAREYEVAEPDFRQSGEYFYRRGFAYFRLGQQQEAREALNRVIEIAPGSESAAQADELLKLLDR